MQCSTSHHNLLYCSHAKQQPALRLQLACSQAGLQLEQQHQSSAGWMLLCGQAPTGPATACALQQATCHTRQPDCASPCCIRTLAGPPSRAARIPQGLAMSLPDPCIQSKRALRALRALVHLQSPNTPILPPPMISLPWLYISTTPVAELMDPAQNESLHYSTGPDPSPRPTPLQQPPSQCLIPLCPNSSIRCLSNVRHPAHVASAAAYAALAPGRNSSQLMTGHHNTSLRHTDTKQQLMLYYSTPIMQLH